VHADVAGEAETAIKHRVSASDIEHLPFANMLFDLLLGTPAGPAAPPVDLRRSAAPTKLRAFLMGYLNRCVLATGVFPAALQTVFLCLNAPDTNQRLQMLGMHFVVRIFEHAPPALLAAMGKLIYSTVMMKFLKSPDSIEVQCATLNALGVLGRKLPDCLRSNTELLTLVFDMAGLSTQQPSLAAAAQEALHLISSAFANPEGSVRMALLALLEKHLSHAQANVAIIALRYCNRVFPKTDVDARYLLLLGACDARDDVMREAQGALYRIIEQGQDVSSKGSAFYPSFPAMLAAVCMRLLALPYASPSHTIPLQPVLMIHTLRYLRCCLGCSSLVDEDEANHVALTGHVGARTRGLSAYLSSLEDSSLPSAVPGVTASLLALIRRSLVRAACVCACGVCVCVCVCVFLYVCERERERVKVSRLCAQ
jgi:hypothetical protein